MGKLLAFASLALACIFVACSQSSSPKPDAGPSPYAIDASAIVGVTAPVPRHRSPGHYVPPPPDPRTPAEIAQAACASPNGAWRCPKMARKMILAASGSSPIIPASWTVSQWYIDPANTTSCASDSNSGTSATCGAGGIGPLATYQELNVHRWGCQGNPNACPRLRQNTTVLWISSLSGAALNADPVNVRLQAEAGAVVTYQGAFNTTNTNGSGTITVVAAKNRSTPQLLEVTLPAPTNTYGQGQIIVNTTHPSKAWLYGHVSGNTWTVTQPLLYTPPAGNIPGVEVDTWATGDAVTVYTPQFVNIVDVSPMVTDYNGGFNNQVYLYDLTVADPSGQGNDNLNISTTNSWIVECNIQRIVSEVAQMDANLAHIYANSVFSGGGALGHQLGSIVYIDGGAVFPGVFAFETGQSIFESDFILGKSSYTIPGGYGCAYIDTGVTWNMDAAGTTLTITGDCTGGPVVWGGGTLNGTGTVHINYPAGAGKAAATFINTGGLRLNGQTKACLNIPSTASTTMSCNLTLTPAQLDTSLGATYGCLVGGGAMFCNGDNLN